MLHVQTQFGLQMSESRAGLEVHHSSLFQMELAGRSYYKCTFVLYSTRQSQNMELDVASIATPTPLFTPPVDSPSVTIFEELISSLFLLFLPLINPFPLD